MGTDARRDQAAEPNTDAIEKRLLANAEIARLIDNSDLASTDGYDLVRSMRHASIIRTRTPDPRKVATPTLPLPSS